MSTNAKRRVDNREKTTVGPGLGIATWSWEPESNSVHYSREWKQLRGLDEVDVTDSVNESLSRVHPADIEELERCRGELIAGVRESYEVDYRVRHESEGWIWISERARGVFENGNVLRVHGCDVDITARKQSELELQKDHQRFTELVGALPVAIIRFENRQCFYASEYWSRQTGRPVESAMGDGWLDAIHPDDRERLLEQINSAAGNGNPDQQVVQDGVQGRHLKPDGSVSWFLPKLRIKFGADGTPASTTLVFVDITERRKFEQHHEMFTTILEATTDYIGVATPQREIIWQNQRLAKLRPDLDNPDDKPDFALGHPEWSQKILEEVAIPAVVEHGTWSGEMAILDMDGNEVPVSQVLIAHRKEDGSVEAISTIMRDTSESKSAEQALFDSERRYSTLLEAIPVGVFRATDQMKLTYVNDGWCKMAGRSADEAMGSNWKQLIHPDDLPLYLQHCREFIADTSKSVSEPFSFRQMMADGACQWFQIQAVKERNEAGEIAGFLGTLSDISEMKRAEQALRESERHFASLAAVAPVTIFRMAKDRSCLYVNERWSEFSSRPREDALGMGWANTVHPDDLDFILKRVDAFENDATRMVDEPIESRHIMPDGSSKWGLSHCAKELDESGNLTGFVGTITDISEVKEAEEKQSLLHDRMQKVLECSSIGIWEWSWEEESLTWDEQMFEMYGVEASDFRRSYADWSDRLHPDDYERMTTLDQCRSERGAAYASEFRIVRPDGELRYVYSNTFVEKDEQGKPIRTIGLNMDVTDRRNAEFALQEARMLIERITENVPGMIYRYVFPEGDVENKFATFVSSKSLDMYGVEPADVLEDMTRICQWIPLDDLARVQACVAQSVRKLEPLVVEYRVSPPGQGTRWHQGIGQPEKLENGDVMLDGVIFDITDRKEAELANDVLAKATKTKDEFLANMSHELRTPLSAILAMTDGLQHGIFGPMTGKQKESLNVVEQSGLHLLDLINEILDLAKIDSGQLDLEISNVDIAKLCESSLSLVARQAEKKDIQLDFNTPWNLPKLRADEKRLRQVLLNLLSNAIKFTDKGGAVRLEVATFADATIQSKDWLRLAVHDTGIGIEANKVDSLFEPFVQVDSSLSRSYEGTGLGLSLVKQFVELHSGHVRVESELGKGSSFLVELPYRTGRLEENTHEQEPLTRLSPATGGKITKDESAPEPEVKPVVLLAEDNDSVAKAVTGYLIAAGFDVLRAADGKAAVAVATERRPDLILMDIQMPVMDGLEAIRRVRAIPGLVETPIIALSGFASDEDSKRCIDSGASLFLSKPCQMLQLVVQIRSLIASEI